VRRRIQRTLVTWAKTTLGLAIDIVRKFAEQVTATSLAWRVPARW
jgi:hypothetical protein